MDLIRILRHPRAAVVAHDLFMVIASWLVAGAIMSKGENLRVISSLPFWSELPLILVIPGLILWSTGLYKGLWRFASFPDLWNIARAALFGTILIIAALYTLSLHDALPI